MQTMYRDATDGHLTGTFENKFGSSSRCEPFAAKMAEAGGCDFSVVCVPGCLFCSDSCRKGAGLHESRHVHDVTGVWDDPVHTRGRCVTQTSITKPSYKVEIVLNSCFSLLTISKSLFLKFFLCRVTVVSCISNNSAQSDAGTNCCALATTEYM